MLSFVVILIHIVLASGADSEYDTADETSENTRLLEDKLVEREIQITGMDEHIIKLVRMEAMSQEQIIGLRQAILAKDAEMFRLNLQIVELQQRNKELIMTRAENKSNMSWYYVVVAVLITTAIMSVVCCICQRQKNNKLRDRNTRNLGNLKKKHSFPAILNRIHRKNDNLSSIEKDSNAVDFKIDSNTKVTIGPKLNIQPLNRWRSNKITNELNRIQDSSDISRLSGASEGNPNLMDR